MFMLGFESRAQQGVTETDAAVSPEWLAVRPAECHRAGHRLQQLPIDGSTVKIDNTDYAAHRIADAWAYGRAQNLTAVDLK